jgi:LacI family transcriptional regulator
VKRISPRTVVTRQSTDTLAVDDTDVATALRFIREKACAGIGVEDVLRVVPLSRSLLERRFKQWIGRSPHREIRAVQVSRAVQLLEETDLPLKRISSQCGFAHMEYFSYLFKRTYGVSPGSYRRSHSALSARNALSGNALPKLL